MTAVARWMFNDTQKNADENSEMRALKDWPLDACTQIACVLTDIDDTLTTADAITPENTLYRDTDIVIVASIQILSRRGVPENIRLIVIDEAHILFKAHRDLLEKYSAVPAIGLTATPLRKGLGQIYCRLVKGPLIADLVHNGYLVSVKGYGPAQAKIEAAISGVGVNYQPGGRDFISKDLSKAMNRKELVGDIISTWMAKAAGLPTLVFAVASHIRRRSSTTAQPKASRPSTSTPTPTARSARRSSAGSNQARPRSCHRSTSWASGSTCRSPPAGFWPGRR